MSVLEHVTEDHDLIDRLQQELLLVRREIREGRFQRSMAVIAAFSAVVSGFEAYAQHVRGAFSHWLMWTPIALTFPMLQACLAALFSERAARRFLLPVSLVSLVDGVVGFVYHLRGIRRMPGGFAVGQYNVVMGPPIFAPLLLCTVGVLGTLASMLQRERLEPGEAEEAKGGRGERGPKGIRLFLRSPLPPPRREGLAEEIVAEVSHGRFQRGMALASVFFVLLAGGEAYFEHLRGSFNQRLMWAPVWVTPPMVAAGVAAALSKSAARWVLPGAAFVTGLVGFLGFALHLRGLYRMPGGFRNLGFNVPMGPPVFAPLLFSSVGLLGFIAVLLRRGRRSL